MFKILLISILFCSRISCSADSYVFPSQMEDEYSNSEKILSNRDPFEKLNRKIFLFNHYLEIIFLKPLTLTYLKVTPSPIQKGVNNIIYNLTVPISIVNALLAGNITDSVKNFWKFTLNTSFGLGGFYNFADLAKVNVDDYNFSKTLQHYKFPQGPYLILPLIGPSNFRGTIGIVADIFIDPVNHMSNKNFQATRLGFTIINNYANKLKYVDKIERNSLDPYSTIKSLYLQNRDFTNKK